MREDWPFAEPTGWLPSEMLDEVSPPTRKTPDDWIVMRWTNGVEVAGPNEDDNDTTGRDFALPGRVKTFRAYFDLGEIEIEVQPDGTCKPSDPLVIEGSTAKATLFCEKDEGDTLAMSLDELARNFVQNYGPLEGSHLIPVQAWHWTKPIPFALTRRDDNSLTFRQLAEEPATQGDQA